MTSPTTSYHNPLLPAGKRKKTLRTGLARALPGPTFTARPSLNLFISKTPHFASRTSITIAHGLGGLFKR